MEHLAAEDQDFIFRSSFNSNANVVVSVGHVVYIYIVSDDGYCYTVC